MATVLALGLALGLVLALGAGPATAVSDPDRIARALSRSPVYVDPVFRDAISQSQRRSLVRALRGRRPPIYVAFVPVFGGDEYGGDSGTFLAVMHDHLGRDGVYVTINDGLLRHRQYGVSRGDEEVVEAASYVIIGEIASNVAPVAHVQAFLTALDDPGVVRRYRDALDARRGDPSPSRSKPDDDGGASETLWVFGGAFLLIFAIAVAVRWSGRADQARYAKQPLPVLPRQVFENARAAAEEDLREQARQAVVDFAAALDPVPLPQDEAAAQQYELAIDASSAASRTLDRARGMLDLAGVLVLVDRGYRALGAAQALAAGRKVTEVMPLCFFNPLHGRSHVEKRWSKGLSVPVCKECSSALQLHVAPDALRDGRKAYMEGDSVWASTGYGVFGDDLVGRVCRGERGRD